MPELEYCLECGEPTGRAGKGEDSIYCPYSGDGPFCDDWADALTCGR